MPDISEILTNNINKKKNLKWFTAHFTTPKNVTLIADSLSKT